MSFKPLADNVLIKVAAAETKSASGFILPENQKKKQTTGEVIAIGSGTLVKDGTRFPIEVEVGQTVLFGEDAGIKLDIDGEDFLVMREYDILGIL